MSTFAVEILQLQNIRPHPNADKMNVVDVWGWQCCIGKDQFRDGDLAVYVPPDFVVPTTLPEFAFLARDGKTMERIRVRRLRGQLSQGLLIPVPTSVANPTPGMDVTEALGIVRYEPPLELKGGGDALGAPSGLYCPKFDVESYERWGREVFVPGEPVVITEKIHGANARYVWAKGPDGAFQQFCGSRTNWWKDTADNIWWTAYRLHPQIGEWCRTNPEYTLFGEVFGQVQDLKYGIGKSRLAFAAFAVLKQQVWLDWELMRSTLRHQDVPVVPEVYVGGFNETSARDLAESDSSWPGAHHEREGVVIVPIAERRHEKIGRVILKMVSNRYLGKA